MARPGPQHGRQRWRSIRKHAPAFMAQAVLGFNEQLERIGEVAVVIAIGALLWAVQWQRRRGGSCRCCCW